MTSASALDRLIDAPTARNARPRGIDRAVMTAAVAMLNWSRARVERKAASHAERSQRLREAEALRQREADALRLAQRLGL
jgi:hypothetical protein